MQLLQASQAQCLMKDTALQELEGTLHSLCSTTPALDAVSPASSQGDESAMQLVVLRRKLAAATVAKWCRQIQRGRCKQVLDAWRRAADVVALSALRAERDAAVAEAAEVVQQLASASTDAQSYTAALLAAQTELEVAVSLRSALERDATLLRGERDELSRQLDKTKAQMVEVATKAALLAAEHAVVLEKASALEHDCTELMSRCSSSEAGRAELGAQLHAVQVQLERALSTRDGQAGELQHDVDKLTREKQELAERVVQLQEDLSHSSARAARLSGEQSAAQDRACALDTELTALATRLSVVEEQRDEAVNASALLQGRVETLQASRPSPPAPSSPSGFGEGSATTREALRELKMKMIDLNTDLELRTAQVSRLEKQCTELLAANHVLQAATSDAAAMAVAAGLTLSNDGGRSTADPDAAHDGVDSEGLVPVSPRRPSGGTCSGAVSPTTLLMVAEASSLRTSLDQACAELDMARDENGQLREDLEHVLQSHADVELALQALQAENKEQRAAAVRTAASLLDERLSTAEAALNDARYQLVALRRKVAAAAIGRWSSAVTRGQLLSGLQALRRNVREGLQRDLTSAVQEREALIAGLRGELRGLSASVQDAASAHTVDNARAAALQGELDVVLVSLKEREGELACALQALHGKEVELDTASARIAELEEQWHTVAALKRVTEGEWREAAEAAESAISSSLALKAEAEAAVAGMAARVAASSQAAEEARHDVALLQAQLADTVHAAALQSAAALASLTKAHESDLAAAFAEADEKRAAAAASEAGRMNAEARALAVLHSPASPSLGTSSGLGRFPMSTALLEAIQQRDETAAACRARDAELATLARQARLAAWMTPASSSLRLNMDFAVLGEEEGREGSAARAAFASTLREDLGTALGVPSGRITVAAFEAGSIIVHFTVLPSEGEQPEAVVSPLEAMASLQVQVGDTSSRLYAGGVTRHADPGQTLSVVYGARGSEADAADASRQDDMQTQILELETDRMQAALVHVALEDQIDELSSQALAARHAVAQGEADKAGLGTALASSQRKVEELYRAVAAAQAVADKAVEAELGAGFARAQVQAEASGLRARVQEAESARDEAEKEAAALSEACARLEAELVDAQEAAEGAATRVREAHRDALFHATSAISEAEARFTHELSEAQEREEAIRHELGAALSALQEGAEEGSRWASQTGCASAEEAGQKLDQMLEAVTQLSAHVESLTQRLAEGESELQVLQANGEGRALALETELEDARRNFEDELRVAEARLAQAARECAAVSAKLSRTTGELESVRVANRSLASELPGLRAEFTVLQEDNDVLQEANEELQGALRQAQQALMEAAQSPSLHSGAELSALRSERDGLAQAVHESEARLATAQAFLAAMESTYVQVHHHGVGDSRVKSVPDGSLTSMPDVSSEGGPSGLNTTVHHFESGLHSVLTASPAVRQSVAILQAQLRKALAERDAVRAELVAVVQAAVSAVVHSPAKALFGAASPSFMRLPPSPAASALADVPAFVHAEPAVVASSLRAMRNRVAQLEAALQDSVLREAQGASATASRTDARARSPPPSQHVQTPVGSPAHVTVRTQGSIRMASPRQVEPAHGKSSSPAATVASTAPPRPMPDARAMERLLVTRRGAGR